MAVMMVAFMAMADMPAVDLAAAGMPSVDLAATDMPAVGLGAADMSAAPPLRASADSLTTTASARSSAVAAARIALGYTRRRARG